MSDYKTKRVNELKDRRDDYLMRAEGLDAEISTLEEEVAADPEVSDVIGKCYIDPDFLMVYAILSPAINHDTKKIIPGKVYVEYHSIDRGEEASVTKGNMNMNLRDEYSRDTEITVWHHDELVKHWIAETRKLDEKVKALNLKCHTDIADAARHFIISSEGFPKDAAQ